MNEEVESAFIESFISDLEINNQGYKNFNAGSNGKEILVRCPFCGDSQNQHHAHLYIQKKYPFTYFCQRCFSKGSVNPEFMEKVDGYSKESSRLLSNIKSKKKYDSNLKDSLSNPLLRESLINKKDFYNIEGIRSIANYDMKRQYLESRLINFTDESFQELKIIPSISYLLSSNFLSNEKKSHVKKTLLASNFNMNNDHLYIGFFTYNYNKIIVRCINNDLHRYYDIDLKPNATNLEDRVKMYSLSNEIKNTIPTLHLVIAEGIIDVINSRYLIFDGIDNSSTIFTSPSGKNYISIIKFLLSLGFLSLRVSLILDSDIDMITFINEYKKDPIINLTKFETTIYWNALDKDISEANCEIKQRRIL